MRNLPSAHTELLSEISRQAAQIAELEAVNAGLCEQVAALHHALNQYEAYLRMTAAINDLGGARCPHCKGVIG